MRSLNAMRERAKWIGSPGEGLSKHREHSAKGVQGMARSQCGCSRVSRGRVAAHEVQERDRDQILRCLEGPEKIAGVEAFHRVQTH